MKSVKQMVVEQLEQQTFAFVTDDDPWVEVKEHFFIDPTKYMSATYRPDLNANKPKQAPAAIKAVKPVGPVTPSQDEAVEEECHCHAPTADEAVVMDVKSCEASIAECTAKNPLYCPYHGTMLVQEDLRKKLLAAGIKGNIDVDADKGDAKTGKGFTVTVRCPKSQEGLVREQLQKFMSLPGISQNEEETDLSYDPVEHGITAWYDVDVLKADEPPMDAPVVQDIVDKEDNLNDTASQSQSPHTMTPEEVAKEIDAIVEDLVNEDGNETGLSDDDIKSIIKNGVEIGTLSVTKSSPKEGGNDYYEVNAENGTKVGVMSGINNAEELHKWAAKNGILSPSQETPAAAEIPEALDFDKEMAYQNAYDAILKHYGENSNHPSTLKEALDEHKKTGKFHNDDEEWNNKTDELLKDILGDNHPIFGYGKKDDSATSQVTTDPYSDAVDKLASVLGEDVKDAIQGYIDNYKATGNFMGIDQFNQNLEKAYKKILGEDHLIFHPDKITEPSFAKEDKPKVAPTQDDFPTLPALPESLDGLTFVDSLGGSTGADLYQDENGNKFVMKRGGDQGGDASAHVTNEYNGLKAYRALGVFCPDAKLYTDKDGNTVMLENFLDGAVELGKFMDNCTTKDYKSIMKQIKDTSFADMLLGNWDAAGTPDSMGQYPNMMVLDGKLCRIDPGGWGKYRAMGAPKDDKDWKDGYPNEIFSMKKFGTTKDFLKDVHPYDILQQIDGLDMSKMLEGLPEDDRAIMEKRIAECQDLAHVGRNYVEDGKYTKDMTDDVLEIYADGVKFGARKALNYGELSVDTITTDSMTYAAPGNKGTSENTKAKIINNLQDRIASLTSGHDFKMHLVGDDILKAIKSINSHAEKGNNDFNNGTIDKALSRAKDIEEAEKALAADPDNFAYFGYEDYLNTFKAALDEIKEVKESGVCKKTGHFDFNFDSMKDMKPVHINPTNDELAEANRLQEELDRAKSESNVSPMEGMNPRMVIEFLCKMDNHRTGMNASMEQVFNALSSQGVDTWPSKQTTSRCHFMKIAESKAMGLDFTEPMKYDHKANYPAMFADAGDGSYAFCGMAYKYNDENGKEQFQTDTQSGSYLATVKYLKNNPNEFNNFYRSFLAMKAVQSLTFANTKFQYGDRDSVMLKRVIPDEVSDKYKFQKGKFNIFPCSFSESAAYGRGRYDSYTSQMWSLTKCPVSRLTGLGCWENTFNWPEENEFGVNLVGIPQYLEMGYEIDTDHSDRKFDKLISYMKKNPEINKENTIVHKPKNLT